MGNSPKSIDLANQVMSPSDKEVNQVKESEAMETAKKRVRVQFLWTGD